jgi:UDPglucose 6-dehydrogenase
MNIAVIGTGYVGLVTGVCFADFGVRVTCVDKDAARITALAAGEIPLHEPRLAEMLRKNLADGRIRFTTDAANAVRQSLVIFIAVGTPSLGDGRPDTRDVDDVARTIGENLDGYKVVVTKSTVPVGTGRRIHRISREHNGHSPAVLDVASNPEFLREGSAVEDFLRPNRVVIGADSPQAIAILRDLYRPLYLIETPFVITTIETAELIKYAANAFLALKISFVNEMANLCEAVGADVHVLAKALGLDKRIGPKFLHPGPGFGGSCFPKDTQALIRLASDHGCSSLLAEATAEVNERQKLRMVDKIITALGASVQSGSLEGLTIGVLGLAFKPNTDDLREAPALFIIRELLRRGATVQAYDPAAMERAVRILPEVDYRRDAYAVAAGADGLVLATEWNEFRNLDLGQLKGLMRQPVLLDLRNVYEPELAETSGFRYEGVGRGRPGCRPHTGPDDSASVGHPCGRSSRPPVPGQS